MLSLIVFSSAIAYLLGSVNTSIIVSKLFGKTDIRNAGSGNAGATNTLRVLGKGAAIIVVAGDFLKGVAAVLIAKIGYSYFGVRGDEMTAQYFAALFVILGHIFPIYFGFKGGKGIMTSIATIFMLDWEIGVILVLIFITLFITTRYVSLGSCVCAAMYPVLVYMFHGADKYFVVTSIIVALLALVMHRSNIERLARGTESKTYFRKH